MSSVRIVGIDPDPEILQALRRSVERSGYGFAGAGDVAEGVRLVRSARPDAVLVRAEAGTLALLREADRDVPMLALVEGGREGEWEEFLGLGGVSVLPFPITEAELAARLGSLLRWARRPADEGVLTVGPVSVDLERGELLRPQAQPLTGSELGILRKLLDPPGRACARRELPAEGERAVDVHVAALRAKLGSAGRRIETVRGVGYRFRP